MKFSSKDLKIFSKQIILKDIGVSGQKKISSSKVLIVGLGGLGCPLLLYLASSGVGNIGIVDNDRVELSNLSRQILYDINDIGRYKVDVAKKRIKKINPKTKISSFKNKIDQSNIQRIASKFDIICDGTDNFTTRFLINDFSKKKKKILISAAISKFEGHLFNFNFKKKTPCYRCFMPQSQSLDRNCEEDGVISPLAGVLGTLQASEVLNTILKNNKKTSSDMLIINTYSLNFKRIKISKNPDCINRC